MTELQRDHLFVSYATEDIALAEWLTYRLTTLGYKVWCDRVKLFGGESYPKDIDDAIKNRTFRFLALLSHASLNKPNPLKERTTALNVAEERHEEGFVIPLNLGIIKTEVPWQVADITWVPFQTNWAEGMVGLLKALCKAKTPRPLEKGRDMVSDSIIPVNLLTCDPETVYSNLLAIKKIPEAVSAIRFEYNLNFEQREALRNIWACRKINNRTFLAFDMPPHKFNYRVQDAYLWNKEHAIEGIDTYDLISELLSKSLECHCVAKGLLWTTDQKWLYFPFRNAKGDMLPFVDAHGKNNNIKVCGEREFFSPGKSSRYRYYLAPTFSIMRTTFGEQFIVKLGLRIRITDTSGRPIRGISAQARRKHVSRDWWNYEWVNRYLALCDFLSDRRSEIVIGHSEPYRVVFSARPLSFVSPLSLDEVTIQERRKERQNSVS